MSFDTMSGCGLDMNDLKRISTRIVEMLDGKKFDVVSYHSRLNNYPRVVESLRLKSKNIITEGTHFKILFTPRRSLSFDLKEAPRFLIESDRQIIVIRHLSSTDTVTRVILISEEIGDRINEKNEE